ncbi:ATP-binding protein [Kitasatospora paracochleata]|uniref:Tetratricopeptide (TPR) repeat protein n=1 Tax=Kitasatospora paracochleata TaxID=58354 RepID=A0ABT1J4G9_9ACTN|nr:AAA family ATPase [Kitasatospora paracochleata]MCP2312324.1 tetratricopeptide (TPR) repeat protein [Kitasatospora paracochleata]
MAAEEHGQGGGWTGGPGVTGRLHERESEIQSARTALSRLARARSLGTVATGELLLYSGSAGMGKTSVLDQVRDLADQQESCTVLFARGGERQRAEPFRVLRQLLMPVLSKLSETERDEVFGNWYGIVGPAVGLTPPSGEVERIDPQGVRDGLDYVLTQLAPRRAPLVIVIDDLHWADWESLTWLASFAVRSRELPVLVVLAYRNEFAEEADGLVRQIEQMASRHHELHTLSPDSVAELVRHQFGDDADDAFCRQVWAVTAGTPYDTVALLREVRDQGIDPVEESTPRLRDLAAAAKGQTLQYWLEKLGRVTLQYAWAAALLGTDIKEELAATISTQGPKQSAESIRALVKHRVLTTLPNGRLEFVHPLIGTSIYQSIPAATKTAMHGIAASAIEDSGGGLIASSRHLLETIPEGDDLLVRKLRRAADQHLRIGAPEAAQRCLKRALSEPPSEEMRAEVLYELGCSALLTDPMATINQLRLALDDEYGLSPDLRVDAVFRLAEVLAHSSDLAAAAELCAEEAERTEPGPDRIRLQIATFMYQTLARDEADGPGRSRRLRSLAEHLPTSGATKDAAHAVHALRAWDLTLRGVSAAEAIEEADAALDRGRLPAGLGWTGLTWGFELPALIGLTFAYTDELARAERLFSDAIVEFEKAGWSGAHRGFAYFLMGLVRFRRGFLLEAEDFLRRGLRLSERIGRGITLEWDIVGVLCDTLLARGRVDDAWELAQKYGFAPPYHPTVMVLPDAPTLYGKLLLARGDRAGAVAVFSEVGAALNARGWHNTVWAPWAGHLAEALAPDDPARARRLAKEAVDRARMFGSPSAVGTALRMEATVSDGPRAVELLLDAVNHLGQSPAGYEHAHALVDLGAALRRGGRLADAAEYLYQGMELAQHCGADGLVARARTELAVSGLRPNRLRTVSKDALSQPEWAVAELAVQGVPPQRIADHLDLPLSMVHRRLAAVHRKAGTGPEGLAAALGLPEPKAEPGAEPEN